MISSSNIKGRIFLKGILENTSPLSVGSGEDDFSDHEVIKRKGKPLIPGTSIMGAIKSYIDKYVTLKKNNQGHLDKLLGNAFLSDDQKNYIQAHFIIDDLSYAEEKKPTFIIRDGVSIDHQKQTAEDQGKYDYELLEPGHRFAFSAEIILRQDFDPEFCLAFAQLVKNIFSTQEVPLQVGAFTSHGFGKLLQEEIKVIDFSSEENMEAYFKFLSGNEREEEAMKEGNGDLIKKYFELNAVPAYVIVMDLKPTTPFFIGGGEPQADHGENGADDASLRSGNNYIVSAKSMKGAVRHHAYRIAKTVHDTKDTKVAEKLTNELFGHSGKEEEKQKKSLFWTSDAAFIDVGDAKQQMQVAIDRFTGGALDSALFSSEPVWPTEESCVQLTWQIRKDDNISEVHFGLLLLVARDLMTEFIAVGGRKGIGRGRFRGLKCWIGDSITDANWYLLEKEGDLSLDKGDDVVLNQYVEAFLNYEQ